MASDIACEQVRVHGLARYEDLTRPSNAMAHVRGAYTEALAQAQQLDGPGLIATRSRVAVAAQRWA